MSSFNFPIVLAGPIIRRVEPTQILIWIATSGSYRINEELFKIKTNSKTIDYSLLNSQSEQKTAQLGDKLFIHLIKINSSQGEFPIDQLIGYNLIFKNDSVLFSLDDLGLLSKDNPDSIVYGNLKYPTFYIKSLNEQGRIIYGSCRKIHGDGKDTLCYADFLLKENHENIKQRPQSLFLLGDQIYADDVPDPLILVITSLGDKLIGQKEELSEIDNSLNLQSFKNSLNLIGGRKSIIKDLCKFTSSSPHNHLMRFGEYAAMYLLTWSPALWEYAHEQDLFETFEDALKREHFYSSFPYKDLEKHPIEINRLKDSYDKQQELLNSFHQSLHRVRRLLANLPTYMIFDDHDITDDWNITFDWKEKVLKSSLGQHVISNSLSAYWAFQGWGNNDNAFSDDFVSIMEEYFSSLKVGKMKQYHQKWMELLWDFDNWHFVAPTSPKAVFLDTRTKRQYSVKPERTTTLGITGKAAQPPVLINEEGWESITKQLYESGWMKNKPLIIASPTPVYGMEIIEAFLQDYVYPLGLLGLKVETTFDLEGWKYNSRGFTSFLQNVLEWSPDPCIILSGDVHYGLSVSSKVTFNNGKKLNIKQFTSSPLKNMSFTSIGGAFLKITIEFSNLKNKTKDTFRYCDHSYRIHDTGEERNIKKQSYIWKDQVRYLPINEGFLFEPENNLGLLTVSSQSINSIWLKQEDQQQM